MKYLLDTHTAIWWLFNPEKLSAKAKQIILDNSTEIFFSNASYWELCIKISLKKLDLGTATPAKMRDELRKNQVQSIGIEPEHCDRLLRLAFHHRDPFDRLLVATAQTANLVLISADRSFDSYSVRRVW
jgi:PIN domain nuclease of toxin-antitoxin system